MRTSNPRVMSDHLKRKAEVWRRESRKVRDNTRARLMRRLIWWSTGPRKTWWLEYQARKRGGYGLYSVNFPDFELTAPFDRVNKQKGRFAAGWKVNVSVTKTGAAIRAYNTSEWAEVIQSGRPNDASGKHGMIRRFPGSRALEDVADRFLADVAAAGEASLNAE